MNWQEFAALLALATAMSFTPGPNTMLATALAANLGLRRALPFVFAVPVGWGLLLCLCALGVGGLVLALPWLKAAITAVGFAYLIWLAWRLATVSSLPPADGEVNHVQRNVGFLQGVLLQFVNIKAWMLALAIIGGWIAGQPSALLRFAQVLPLMLAYALASNLCYALIGSVLRAWLAQGRRLQWFNRGMALVLVLTALWMIIR
jgi:threonine/homoserine/homoserine lactone efflux protein